MLKLRRPSPSSSGVSRGFAAISPQTETGMRMRSAASVANCTSRSTAGCSGSYRSATSLSAAIHRQRVGGQVVGADGEEIRLQRQRVGRQRGARRFDHDAERRQLVGHPLAAPAQPPGHALIDLARRAHLGDRWSPSAASPAPGRPWRRAGSPRTASPAVPAWRSSSRMPRRPSAGLASATSGTMPALDSASMSFSPPQSSTRMVTGSPPIASMMRAIGFGLGVLVRHGLAVHEQELGAQQADADARRTARSAAARSAAPDWPAARPPRRPASPRAGGAAGRSAAARGRRR